MPDNLHFLLMKSFHSCNKAIIKKTAELSLLPGQAKVLECLLECDGLTPKEIARRCSIDKSTITGLLKKMEEKYLIDRIGDSDDRRAVQIMLTEEGKHYAEQAVLIGEKTDALAASRLSTEQRESLMDLLRTVIATLEDENSDP
ncbi:MAG: MarR family transcriptional regulator [Eubacteriales bacterium]|nr:MarR family transcriptional regulator [Eubacteriales bacterium]